RRCSDRAGCSSIYGLIAVSVGRVCPSFANVGREGHVAISSEQLYRRTTIARSNQPVAFAPADKLQGERAGFDFDRLPLGELAARLTKQLPNSLGVRRQEQPFPLSACPGATAKESGRQDPRVV